MRLIVSVILLVLLKTYANAEEKWCTYIDTEGKVLIEKVCEIEFQKGPSCGFGILNGEYKISFNQSSSAKIENRCSKDGEPEVFVNDKFANVSKVTINEQVYYDVYLQTDERFLFEATETGSEFAVVKAYPPWSRGGKNEGLPGQCYFIGSDSKNYQQCKQYTECDTSDEGGEGGCIFRYFFDSGGSIGFSGAEESYGVLGQDFGFGYGEILRSNNKTCYPYNKSGMMFCYEKSGAKLEPILSNSNTSWGSIGEDKRHLIYGTDGLNYGSQVVIEEWRENKLAWKLESTVTCSNGAVICYLLVPNASGLEGNDATTSVVIERIDTDDDGVDDWIILAAFEQGLYYNGGGKVSWFNGFKPDENERITAPNIYKRTIE